MSEKVFISHIRSSTCLVRPKGAMKYKKTEYLTVKKQSVTKRSSVLPKGYIARRLIAYLMRISISIFY